MSRAEAVAGAERYFDEGGFFAELARRVAYRSTSQEADRRPLDAYLAEEMAPSLGALGYVCQVLENPAPKGGPFLIARRHEGDGLPTVLTYGHGDVVRGLEPEWADGLDPWTLTRRGERWYGRGTADNKGQHTINQAALRAVLAVRGRLGFNSTVFLEMSEEIGSPGLHAFAAANRRALAADLLLASDGPRLAPDRPTLFMGSRGVMNFELEADFRAGGHHSGNWGGLLANPGTVLAHAIASLVGPRGEIRVAALRPEPLPNSIRAALAGLEVDGGADGPAVDPDWGEPGLTPAERVFGWPTLEVLAFKTGNPERPVNAVPPSARATCQIRFTAGMRPDRFLPAIRAHLDRAGFATVAVRQSAQEVMQATRLLPDHPWVEWAAASIERTTGRPPVRLPNLGGSLPNDVFMEILGMPTVWVPHSYAACSQHAPNEHLLAPLAREALAIMAGLFWDLGEGGLPGRPA